MQAKDAVWLDTGGYLPVVGSDDGATVVTAVVGQGRVYVLAESAIVSNGALAREDNAALGLAMAGDPARGVRFAEYVHGYEPESGFGALPPHIQAALWTMALAGAVWMWSRARRLGPPQDTERDLPPPREWQPGEHGLRSTRPDHPWKARCSSRR